MKIDYNVTLIHARTDDNPLPPIGLLYIGAVLEDANFNVQVLDPLPDDNEFFNKVKEFNPSLIGISLLTTQFEKAKNMIKGLKSVVPNAVYCCGGVQPTAQPEETFKKINVDFLVFGEGEYTLLEICQRLSSGKTIDGVDGILFKNNGKIIKNKGRKLIENLDELPLPGRHLVDFNWYLTPPGFIRGRFYKRTTTLIATRGCPFQCIYCGSNTVFGKKVRRRSAENVVGEIEHLISEYKIDGYWFIDDTFTVNKNWVVEFCNMLLERGVSVKWACQARVDCISEKLLLLMKKAGCVQLDFGVESGSNKVLKILKKGTTSEMIISAFELAKRVGLRRFASFMIGSPGETREDIDATLTLAKRIDPDFTSFFYHTPFPGTESYKMAIENNWIKSEYDFSTDWSIRQTEFPIMAINFDKKELRKIRADLQNQFLFKNYILFVNKSTAVFILHVTYSLLKNYRNTFLKLCSIFRTQRIDDLVEFAMITYRNDLYKKLKRVIANVEK